MHSCGYYKCIVVFRKCFVKCFVFRFAGGFPVKGIPCSVLSVLSFLFAGFADDEVEYFVAGCTGGLAL